MLKLETHYILVSVCLLKSGLLITRSCLFKVITLTHKATQMKHTCLSAKFGVTVNPNCVGSFNEAAGISSGLMGSRVHVCLWWLFFTWKGGCEKQLKGVTSPAANNTAVGMCLEPRESLLNKKTQRVHIYGDWPAVKVIIRFSLFTLIFLEDLKSALEDYKQEHGRGKHLLD